MICLVDGDLIGWRCAPVCEGLDEKIALWQADELVRRIVTECGTDDYKIYLSGDNNFRYNIYPEYKANRRDKPRPTHLEAIRAHLITEWDASICDGYEADDALGMALSEGTEGIVASIDKDLLQVPGKHYHFVNREFITITEIEGWRNFYSQVLTGDVADNVPGCPGIGKVKAPRLLQPCNSELDMYNVCLSAYKDIYAKRKIDGDPVTDMHRNANLLYIWRREDDLWPLPC